MDHNLQKNTSVGSDLHNVTREDQKIPQRISCSTSKATKIKMPLEQKIEERWLSWIEEQKRQFDEQNSPSATSPAPAKLVLEKNETLADNKKLKLPSNEFLMRRPQPNKHIQRLNFKWDQENIPSSNAPSVKLAADTRNDKSSPKETPIKESECSVPEISKILVTKEPNIINKKINSLKMPMSNLHIEDGKVAKTTEESKESTKEKDKQVRSKPKVQCSLNIQSMLSITPFKRPTSPKALLKGGKDTVDANNAKRTSDEKAESSTDIRNCKIKDIFKVLQVHKVEYLVLNVLGKGGSSIVYHCYEPKARQEYAIKCVDLRKDATNLSGFLKEVDLLKKLRNCDRIVKLLTFEINQEKNTLYVVLEKGGQDFSRILREYTEKRIHVPEFLVYFYWKQMLLAVKQIHSHGIVHADLKPANFLVSNDRMKLIDFGISCCVDNNMTSAFKDVALGTFNYMSPEAMNNENSSNVNSPNFGKAKFKLSFKTDVWSLGCILYELIYGRAPFSHITHSAVKLSTIMNPKHVISYPEVDRVSSKLVLVLKECLQYNIKARPSVDDLIAHAI